MFGVFNTAVYYLPYSQNMKAKCYNSVLLTENTKTGGNYHNIVLWG